jgi:hypothetical protein
MAQNEGLLSVALQDIVEACERHAASGVLPEGYPSIGAFARCVALRALELAKFPEAFDAALREAGAADKPMVNYAATYVPLAIEADGLMWETAPAGRDLIVSESQSRSYVEKLKPFLDKLVARESEKVEMLGPVMVHLNPAASDALKAVMAPPTEAEKEVFGLINDLAARGLPPRADLPSGESEAEERPETWLDRPGLL